MSAIKTDISRTGLSFILLSLALLFIQGCSYQAWYEGFRERERQECYKHLNTNDIETCLERVNSLNYNEYRRSRSD